MSRSSASVCRSAARGLSDRAENMAAAHSAPLSIWTSGSIGRGVMCKFHGALGMNGRLAAADPSRCLSDGSTRLLRGGPLFPDRRFDEGPDLLALRQRLKVLRMKCRVASCRRVLAGGGRTLGRARRHADVVQEEHSFLTWLKFRDVRPANVGAARKPDDDLLTRSLALALAYLLDIDHRFAPPPRVLADWIGRHASPFGGAGPSGGFSRQPDAVNSSPHDEIDIRHMVFEHPPGLDRKSVV